MRLPNVAVRLGWMIWFHCEGQKLDQVVVLLGTHSCAFAPHSSVPDFVYSACDPHLLRSKAWRHVVRVMQERLPQLVARTWNWTQGWSTHSLHSDQTGVLQKGSGSRFCSLAVSAHPANLGNS